MLKKGTILLFLVLHAEAFGFHLSIHPSLKLDAAGRLRTGAFMKLGGGHKRLKGLHQIKMQNKSPAVNNILLAVATLTAYAPIANAKDGQFGILETSWAGMLHPVGMILLYLITFKAGYHGIQWRRIRDIAQEINELKAKGAAESEISARQTERSGLQIVSKDHWSAVEYLYQRVFISSNIIKSFDLKQAKILIK